MKRYSIITIILIFALQTFVASAKPKQLTPTITWELQKDGTLMITGAGDMPDFKAYTDDFWIKEKTMKKIKKIVIGEGITSIGDCNFYGFISSENLSGISLPTSLRSIGENAFGLWPRIPIEIPDGVELIDRQAFKYSIIQTIKLPKNVKIGQEAFYGSMLKNIDFQNGSPSIGERAFVGCLIDSVENADNLSEEYLNPGYFTGPFIDGIMQIRLQKEKELAGAEAQKRLEEEADAKKRAEEAEALKPKPKAVAKTVNSPTTQPISQIVWPADRRVVRVNNYDSDFRFTDGMLPIWNSDLNAWGFVDESGRLAVPYEWQFDSFDTPHFDSGHCLVAKYEKSPAGISYKRWYIIDKQGRSVKLPANIEKVSNFQNGIASVVSKKGNVATQFFINTKGVRVFPNLSRTIMWAYVTPDPIAARPFKNGLAAYYDRDTERYGFINTKGQFVVKPVFLDAHDFSDGLAAVKLPATQSNPAAWGFIDTSGKMVIPAKFSIEPGNFRTGRAPVEKRNGHKVMIDKSGEVVSPEFYELSECFSNGNAIAGNRGYNYFLIDSDYKQISEGMPDISLKDQPFLERNGVFVPFYKGQYGATPRLTSTAKFLLGQTKDGRAGYLSDNLIHIKYNGIDAFMTYDGVVVFSIEDNEF